MRKWSVTSHYQSSDVSPDVCALLITDRLGNDEMNGPQMRLVMGDMADINQKCATNKQITRETSIEANS